MIIREVAIARASFAIINQREQVMKERKGMREGREERRGGRKRELQGKGRRDKVGRGVLRKDEEGARKS